MRALDTEVRAPIAKLTFMRDFVISICIDKLCLTLTYAWGSRTLVKNIPLNKISYNASVVIAPLNSDIISKILYVTSTALVTCVKNKPCTSYSRDTKDGTNSSSHRCHCRRQRQTSGDLLKSTMFTPL